MRAGRFATGVLMLASALMLLGATKGGCGEGLDNRKGEPGIDVGGKTGAHWKVEYSNQLEIIVKKAGAVVSTTSYSLAAGGEIDMEGIKVDLAELCARDDVACPHEVFPKEVLMTQPGSELHLLYVTYNPAGPLQDLTEKTLLGNVDSDDDFSIALGIGAAAKGTCGLLAVSYATGHIDNDGGDPPSGIQMKGDIVTAYTGGCVLLGSQGSAGAGLTVEVRLPFNATRVD